MTTDLSEEPVPVPTGWQNRPAPAPWHPPELAAALAPFLGGFDYHDDLTANAPALAGWRVLAGTRRGRLHAHHGTHREDAFFHGGDAAGSRFWIFCVCDGAGSSRLSRVGAEITCRRVVHDLTRVFHENAAAWNALSIDALKPALENAIADAVRADAEFLAALAAESNHEPRDFRCTLLLTVLYRHADDELACLSQVGDGFLAGLNRQGNARRYGAAHPPGGYSGEVDCFVPDEGCVAQARPFGIIADTSNLDALLLCTDGIEDPFYPVETQVAALFEQFTRGTPASAPPGLTWPAPVPRLVDPYPDVAQQHLAASFHRPPARAAARRHRHRVRPARTRGHRRGENRFLHARPPPRRPLLPGSAQ